MITKTCCKCKKDLPICMFGKSNGNLDGFQSWCNKCKAEQLRNSRHARGLSTSCTENTKCSQYLGITIGEKIASSIFGGAIRMPSNNIGYDIMCHRGYKVEVKSSVLHTWKKKYNTWSYKIDQNTIPDCFLLLAFDDRINHNLVHVWLIPKSDICHKTSVGISPSKLSKWNKYEYTKWRE